MVNGNNILIYATTAGQAEVVAACRSLSLQVGTELIETLSTEVHYRGK